MTTTDFKVDKSTWARGPWDDEPDRVDFIAEGFACLALRHPDHGHFCGYVGVPREHPLYGRLHADIAGLELGGWEINYAAPCDEGGLVCHTPPPGMPADVWWIGGDFGHWNDRCPGRDARLREAIEGAEARGLYPVSRALKETSFEREMVQYRDLVYVRAQIVLLARELRAIAEASR